MRVIGVKKKCIIVRVPKNSCDLRRLGMQQIALAAPEIDDSDVQAVVEVLRSGRLALGPKAEEFERLIAEYVGVKHAVAVSSGTAVLAGREPSKIIELSLKILRDDKFKASILAKAGSPFGEGRAAEIIVDVLSNYIKTGKY